MITRYWKGITYPDKADNYEWHLNKDTLPILREISGFVGMQILRREVSTGIEFLILTTWESMEAIYAFAGGNCELAVVPDKAKAMMVSYDQRVIHYSLTHHD
ncbi:MAG: antibiotic biosynthesis monooxygenase family protein [Fulvivirga sp.]